eukprot:1157443-Pelagomonas_calceolata.AAC.7
MWGVFSLPTLFFLCWGKGAQNSDARRKREKKSYVGRGNVPYNNQGKGDTLDQKSHKSPPPQSYKAENDSGGQEGSRKNSRTWL